MRRQRPNVERMNLLGAEVRSVDFGTRTLKEATSEAIRDWITNVETTHYLIGSCVGPAPYPEIVHELQAVIGREARGQFLETEGRLPEVVVACVGGGSNAIGIFAGFLDDTDVRLIGVEAADAASLGAGNAGVSHGARSSVLSDEDGQIADAHSISAGLDYPGVGPEHAWLRNSGRAEYVRATDDEALGAFRDLTRLEGIIPALEPAHALARAASSTRSSCSSACRAAATRISQRCSPDEQVRPGNGTDVDVRFPDELRVDELLLRGPIESDVDTIAPAFRDPAVGGEASLPPVDADTLRVMLRDQLPGMRAQGLLAAYVIQDVRDDELLGGASLHHFDPLRDVVEIGYWLFVSARGRGVATRSVRQMTEHAVANGIWRVEAHVRIGNNASEGVLSGSASSARALSGSTSATETSASTRR